MASWDCWKCGHSQVGCGGKIRCEELCFVGAEERIWRVLYRAVIKNQDSGGNPHKFLKSRRILGTTKACGYRKRPPPIQTSESKRRPNRKPL
ncbi:OLC1v1030446C1 [Oldenlandia corymbosa var. corymbosa]|uniref:OLC1v1030446C1 n=1 Tax=Oldenlandia corymbosa var. corymbosa TaxID=529605 RepID=A0AAV1CHN3_OLDCO|nr:OLC1v1030446C1 [Oldenlandia corymbosa var. corymbosa]